MDISEVLKLGIKLMRPGKLTNRAQEARDHRLNNRNKEIAARRQISNTPLKLSPEDPIKMSSTSSNRMELLKKWKEQKAKRKAEEDARRKPRFKVSHVDQKTYEDNKLPTVSVRKDTTPSIYKFAPSVHKFRVGSAIKPINFKYGESKENVGAVKVTNTRRVLNFKQESGLPNKDLDVGNCVPLDNKKLVNQKTTQLSQKTSKTTSNKPRERLTSESSVSRNTRNNFKNVANTQVKTVREPTGSKSKAENNSSNKTKPTKPKSVGEMSKDRNVIPKTVSDNGKSAGGPSAKTKLTREPSDKAIPMKTITRQASDKAIPMKVITRQASDKAIPKKDLKCISDNARTKTRTVPESSVSTRTKILREVSGKAVAKTKLNVTNKNKVTLSDKNKFVRDSGSDKMQHEPSLNAVTKSEITPSDKNKLVTDLGSDKKKIAVNAMAKTEITPPDKGKVVPEASVNATMENEITPSDENKSVSDSGSNVELSEEKSTPEPSSNEELTVIEVEPKKVILSTNTRSTRSKDKAEAVSIKQEVLDYDDINVEFESKYIETNYELATRSTRSKDKIEAISIKQEVLECDDDINANSKSENIENPQVEMNTTFEVMENYRVKVEEETEMHIRTRAMCKTDEVDKSIENEKSMERKLKSASPKKKKKQRQTKKSTDDDDEVVLPQMIVKTPKKVTLVDEETPENSVEKVTLPKTPRTKTPRTRKSLAFEFTDTSCSGKKIEDSIGNCSVKSVSPGFPSPNNDICDNDIDQCVSVTPKPELVVTTYISPFVTMSRGKQSARKEYHRRVSKGGICDSSPEATGPQAGAAYFTRLLDTEISRIKEMCQTWTKYMEDNELLEEACNMINTALGQSGLLLAKRMQQFRRMIASCRAQDTDPLISCMDLHGYWDMLMTQVKNLDDRFDNLVKLRKNNWEEVLPEKKVVITKPKIVKRPVRKAAVKAGTSIRAAIKAARNRLKDNDGSENMFHGGFFMVKSPGKVVLEKTPKDRKSLLQEVLTSEKNRKPMLSPGLIMCSATRRSKSIGMSESELLIKEPLTPVKSILKSRESKSTMKKAVLFNEDINDTLSPKNGSYTISDENDPNMENLLPVIEDESSMRPSRLTRSRLF